MTGLRGVLVDNRIPDCIQALENRNTSSGSKRQSPSQSLLSNKVFKTHCQSHTRPCLWVLSAVVDNRLSTGEAAIILSFLPGLWLTLFGTTNQSNPYAVARTELAQVFFYTLRDMTRNDRPAGFPNSSCRPIDGAHESSRPPTQPTTNVTPVSGTHFVLQNIRSAL